MTETVSLVHQFHEAFDICDKGEIWIHDEEVNALRVSLLQEELDELKEALENKDAVEVLDALTDLQYVLDGAYLQFGLANLKTRAFNEVHKSNMSKLDIDGRPLYREDGKVLKGPNYKEPDLKSLVEAFEDQVKRIKEKESA